MGDPAQFHLAGRGPEAYEAVLGTIMAPFVAALLDAVDPTPGDAVLDVACGTGFVTRAAASRVGPDGRLAGVDLNPDMLTVARRAAGQLQPPVDWREAPADALPFDDATFDAVVCQQGVQFFPALDAALAEAARVTRAGGHVAATAFLPRDRSPYFDAQYRAVEALAGPSATDSFARAFGASGERVSAAFRAAGLHDVATDDVVVDVVIPDLADYVPRHLLAIPWGVAVAEARPDDGIELATAAILERLDSYTDAAGTLTAPFASLLVTGRR